MEKSPKKAKLEKKHWWMIYIGGTALALLVFFIYCMDGISLKEYEGNPNLYEIAKDFKEGNLDDFYLYRIDGLADAPCFFELCLIIVEDEPSYYSFLTRGMSLSNITAPQKIPAKWKIYYDSEMRKRASFLDGLVLAGKKYKKTFPILIKHLKSKSIAHRATAAQALGKLGDERAVDPLINALKDKEATVQHMAAIGLIRFKNKKVAEAFMVLLKSKDKTSRHLACTGLIRQKDKRAVDALIDALGDKDAMVRGSAAIALGDSRDKRALEPLIKLLGDPNSNVRLSTAFALETLGDKKAIPALERHLKTEKNGKVKEIMNYAIKTLKKSPLNRTG